MAGHIAGRLVDDEVEIILAIWELEAGVEVIEDDARGERTYPAWGGDLESPGWNAIGRLDSCRFGGAESRCAWPSCDGDGCGSSDCDDVHGACEEVEAGAGRGDARGGVGG